MTPTNFAKYLTEFLSVYLPSQKNVSKNTIHSYRDTFKLVINFCKEIKNISSEQITLDTLSSELITDFLEWIEANRKCSISTRNQRLAAIHSFFRYVQAEEPSG
ncbi:MAG: integrase, partial [Alphaproteobacteria bacterium]|nr:integrase [Alphaproteobacteria bacterium]